MKKSNINGSSKDEEKLVSVVEQSDKAEQNTNPPSIHYVEKGDSLFFISKKYNILMEYIERWNNVTSSSVLEIGDVIYLSAPKEAVKSQ